MTQENNIAAQQKFGEAINTRNFDLFDDVVAPASVDHDPAPGQAPGPQGYKDLFTQMTTAFPDLHIEVERLVANDTDVAIAYTMTGTQRGPFLGNDATGKSVSVRGVQISRFDNGLVVERWGSSDQLGILQQLGLAPTA
ncbi:ester cyclase [Cryobacterium tepidiphilum]|uniref:Ester cyclase n=1 Tax=Cryobacterium tepidiphilum TaxID=2486026 RepID=A0A3M8KUD7_9MICO|nr:ester cyclase [Cryobacterium tepidiphilum]RNE56756.1 ester cyclase [Cryobacterium tepidiphilum]